MQAYKISKKHESSKKHIEFFSSPENGEFRDACKCTFSKHGFNIEFDGNYLYVTHPDKSSPLSEISIESDQWGGIWGEASPWGSDEDNHAGIDIFEKILNESGEFVAK